MLEFGGHHMRTAPALIFRSGLALLFLIAIGLTLLTPQGAMASDRDDDLFTEGFEGAWLPTGWHHIQDHLSTWTRSSYDSHSGNYCAAIWWNAGVQDEWLITPAIDLTGSINPKLEFYERAINWSDGGHHYVMVSTTSQTDPAAFSIVADMTPANHTVGGFEGEPATVSLIDYVDEPVVYIAIRFTGNAGTTDTWMIDDVRVYKPSGHDVGVTAALPDGGTIPAGTPVIPQATVENFGLGTESFDVQLQINESGTIVHTETLPVTDLAPGMTETLNYTSFTPAVGNYYDIVVTSLLDADGDASNNIMTGMVDTWFEPHVPLGMLFTNSGCDPCVQANVALDAYMANQGNSVALLRVHVSWPWGGDVIWQANQAQAGWLVSEFGVSGVPDFWRDTYYYVDTHSGTDMVTSLEDGKDDIGPLNIGLAWNNDTDMLSVSVNVTGAIRPGGNYSLFCSITEDNISHLGPNGEPVHHQAFRYMYPDVQNGTPISANYGTEMVPVHCPLDGSWDYSELRASVYVRDMNSGETIQAATNFLTNIEDVTHTDGTVAAPFGLLGNHPNPFNPTTSIEYSLESAGPASLLIYDPAGRLVRTVIEGVQSAGNHTATWNGVDDQGHTVASGIYLVRLQSGTQQDVTKVLLAK
jgi:hypothetical protein